MMNISQIQTAFKSQVGFREEMDLTIGRQTSGTLVVGQTYKILNYITNDDFSNVANVISGVINTTGCVFIATGTTPAHWTHLSVLQDLQYITSDSSLFVNDVSGIDLQVLDKIQWINSDLTKDTITDYIDKIYNPTVISMIYNFLNKLQEQFINRELKKDNYNVVSSPEELVEQEGKFIGYFVQLNDSLTLRFLLKAIALQVNKAQTVKIFLYNLNQKVAVNTFDFVVSGDRTRIYQDFENTLSFSDDTSSGNMYLIGYFENISGNTQTWMLDNDSQAYNSMIEGENEYCKIYPISLDIDRFSWTGTTYNLIDVLDWQNFYYDNYNKGLCLKYAIDCDYTHIITDNKLNFAKCLQYELALRIINDALSTKTFNQITESNRKEWEGIKIFIENELKGYDYKYKGGEAHSKGLYDLLLSNFQNIDCECFKSNYIKFM